MADKNLTESAWKTFAKKHDYKDAALLKAFTKFEAASNADPKIQLAALDDLDKEAGLLRKAYKADKELAGYLDDVEKSLAKERKAVEQAAKKAEASAAEEDDEGPGALTTKMVPLLRDMAKGKPMHARVAIFGKAVAVLVSRKPLAPASNKLLNETLKEKSGVKYFDADGIFEGNALTFVMQARPGNAAKLIKQALLDQTGLRLKVRVRGTDPADVDEAGEENEKPETDDEADAGKAGTSATAKSTDAPGRPQNATAAPDAQRLAYEQQLARIDPRVAEALKKNVGDVGKIRAVSLFAQGKAESGDYKAALQALQTLQGLLPSTTAAAAPAASTPAVDAPKPAAPADPLAAFKARLGGLVAPLKGAIDAGRPDGEAQRARIAQAGALANKKEFERAAALLDEVEAWLKNGAAPGAAGGRTDGDPTFVTLQKSRLAWDGLRKTLQSQLQDLERDILATVKANNEDESSEEEFDEGEVAAGVKSLHGILDRLDTRLIDKLDAALNAEGGQRAQLHEEAADLVTQYQAFVESDPTIAAIDANGFTATSIRAAARRTLAELAAQL